MKTMIALAAAAVVFASAGCCWPLHEGGHRRYGGWSESSREPSRQFADRRAPDRYQDRR
jgi:hypothetical protein